VSGFPSPRAEADFRQKLAEAGATPLFTEWRGVSRPHRVQCSEGHESAPFPSNTRRRGFSCRTCAGRDPKSTEAAFRACLAAAGATPAYDRWLDSLKRHHVVCAAGHDCYPYPTNVLRGIGLCRICSRRDPGAAEAAFRTLVATLGGKVTGQYAGTHKPVLCICRAGHNCKPFPTNVLKGQGMCLECSGQTWDAFYVVTSEAVVKFGITKGDPRPRMWRHHSDGYRTTVRLLTDLPLDARPIEQAVVSAVRLAGWKPVRGREYFAIDALPVVLDIVDNYPIPAGGLQASEEE
jgi:hypothetical protein